MMTLGMILSLLGLVGLVVGVVALIRPQEAIGLGTRQRAGFALLGSFFASIAGMIIAGMNAPPAATGGEAQPAAASRPAAAPPAKKAEAPARPQQPSLGLTSDQVLQRLNAKWAVMEQVGAFAVRQRNRYGADHPTSNGGNLNACATPTSCVMLEMRQDDQVVSAIMMSAGPPLEVMAASASVVGAFEDDLTGLGDIMTRQTDRLARGREVEGERFRDVCVRMSAVEGMGVWMTVTPPPCDE